MTLLSYLSTSFKCVSLDLIVGLGTLISVFQIKAFAYKRETTFELPAATWLALTQKFLSLITGAMQSLDAVKADIPSSATMRSGFASL